MTTTPLAAVTARRPPTAPDTDAAIDVRALTKSYGTTQALDGIDLTVPRGSVLGVLGPNGAGKTTLIRILSTLLPPDSGTALVDGHDVVATPQAVRAAVGLTGQYASVDESLSGRQNLYVVARLHGFTRSAARRRTDDLLARFSLTEAATRLTRTYSGGMRRRLDLATSLVAAPRVLYLDEPTTGLDPRARNEVWAEVRRLVEQEGTTVLLTTQYMEEADALADAITVIDHGRVIAHGTADALKSRLGGRILHVRPTDPAADLDAIAQVLATASGGRTPDLDHGSGTATLPLDDDRALTTAIAALGASGIPLAAVETPLPSLDEVFLTITDQEPRP
ncbi:ATP-binding cassette domain-containing protein [Peterkaempfera bronchialis]|uniref:ATP-binding cassette domain-containing protein n=1 Tax=Peterkaempfera bronchialis TaxID=2126346 RepID=UPI003C2EA8D8